LSLTLIGHRIFLLCSFGSLSFGELCGVGNFSKGELSARGIILGSED